MRTERYATGNARIESSRSAASSFERRCFQDLRNLLETPRLEPASVLAIQHANVNAYTCQLMKFGG
jgi:hypothetical protein